MKRRQVLFGVPAVLAAPALVGLLPQDAAAGISVREGDRILGEADAPVTIVEYASLTCPHCATFHVGILPRIREEWINDGQARLVYRHFPLDSAALGAAVVAEQMADDRAFFAFLGALFENQAQWARASDPLREVVRMAGIAGLDEEAALNAAEDQETIDRILHAFIEARDDFEVSATPTLFVNGKKLVGVSDYESFAGELERAS